MLRALIVPRRCVFCADTTTSEQLCEGCRLALPWNRLACPRCALPQNSAPAQVCAECAKQAPAFDSAWSAFRYEAPIAQAIQGLKYSAQFRYARLLADAMAEKLARRSQPLPELLLPMPLHPRRLRSRGYNQALELARAMTRHLAIAIDPHAAVRVRATEDQIGKSAVERRRNVKGAFAVDARILGPHIAIVDDVMTTGSSAAELARVCRAAGATRIEVWTAARAV